MWARAGLEVSDNAEPFAVAFSTWRVRPHDAMRYAPAMPEDHSPEFMRGWDAAIAAIQDWHAAKAKQCLVRARRDRFPKNLEREAEMHTQAAEAIKTIGPDDV